MQKLLNQAKKELTNLHSGEVFQLKDLFKGYGWKRIQKCKRLELGKQFLEYVNSSSDVKTLDKKSDNHYEYKKL